MSKLCPDCFEIMLEGTLFCDSCWEGSAGGIAVVVSGDRAWSDWGIMSRALWCWKPEFVISGGAKGADQMAEAICVEMNQHMERADKLQFERIDADWEKYTRAAGPIRNSEMLARLQELRDRHGYSIVCLAFHRDLKQSKGTRNCVKQALQRGIEVRWIGKTSFEEAPPHGRLISIDEYNASLLMPGEPNIKRIQSSS